jgi:hypothetical protein
MATSPSTPSPSKNGNTTINRGNDGPGRHRITTDAMSLTAVIDDGSSMLNQLISDVQLRAHAAEAEVRALRDEKDQLENKLYEQRYGYEQRLSVQQQEILTLQAQIRAMTARGM